MNDARAAEKFLHEQIPLTRAMEVRVVPNETSFIVEAPVGPNHNHLETAFGGSINALATLAGYGLLWEELRGDRTIHLVVRESSIRFLHPVREIIRAVCDRPAPAEIEQFKKVLAAKGRARLRLMVTVMDGAKTAAEFTGIFVARKRRDCLLG